MSLLNASHVAFCHPTQSQPIFTDVSFTINLTRLVRINGAGKRPLQLLTREREPTAGTLVTSSSDVAMRAARAPAARRSLCLRIILVATSALWSAAKPCGC